MMSTEKLLVAQCGVYDGFSLFGVSMLSFLWIVVFLSSWGTQVGHVGLKSVIFSSCGEQAAPQICLGDVVVQMFASLHEANRHGLICSCFSSVLGASRLGLGVLLFGFSARFSARG